MRRLPLFLMLIVLASGGCSRGLGPQNLAVDRTAYIEALGDSWREQLLFNIVKVRYHDALTFLDVSSITQAYTLEANANASYNIGWGEGTTTSTVTAPPVGGPTTTSQRALNLFPRNTFTAGISSTYRTLPTITFTPIAGEVIKNTIFSPLKPINVIRALMAGWKGNFIIPYCCLSINNVQGILQNPNKMNELVEVWDKLVRENVISYDFKPPKPKDNGAGEGEGANDKPDKKGEKINGPKPKPTQQDKLAGNLVEFTSNLVKKQKEEKKEEVAFIILDKKNDHHGNVQRFQKLLGLVDNKSGEYEVVSEIQTRKEGLEKIYVQSRSVFQILTLLAMFIDVPTSQETWVWPGKTPMELSDIPHFHILTTPGLMRPNEFAAIKYKGNWFYIPNWDTDTKRVFSGLMAIFSMMETAPSKEPILTIPVR